MPTNEGSQAPSYTTTHDKCSPLREPATDLHIYCILYNVLYITPPVKQTTHSILSDFHQYPIRLSPVSYQTTTSILSDCHRYPSEFHQYPIRLQQPQYLNRKHLVFHPSTTSIVRLYCIQ